MFRIIIALVISFACLTSATASPGNVTLRFDYQGAEALLDALDRDALTDADIEALLAVRGVRAMVDNVTKYAPQFTRERFRTDLQDFVKTRDPKKDWGVDWERRTAVRALLAEVKAHETAAVKGILAVNLPYQPVTGDIVVTIYLVVGGVSDGFVLDGDAEPAFFVAIDKADGDRAGLQQNMAHEVYHVMQRAAARRVPALQRFVGDLTGLPPVERLVVQTLWEGTANFVADASKSTARGPYIDMWRERYRRNATPERITENFALFDRILADVRANRISWDEVEKIAFSGNNDARFYFVGYEMAKALAKHQGPGRIARLFQEPPASFFKAYIALYRERRDITARFSPETEAVIAGLP